MANSSPPAPTEIIQKPSFSEHQREELEAILPSRTPQSSADSFPQQCASKSESNLHGELDTVPQVAIRSFFRRSLARAFQDVAFAIFPLYFVVFAIVTHVQNAKPSKDYMNASLLAMANYGPTAFGIMFAAVVGRSLTCTAAVLLESGASVGAIESLLGARTVFGAATLPLRFRFFHPLMLLMTILWILSPLGGQAALRVIGIESRETTRNANFTYLDTYASVAFTSGGQSSWRNAIVSSFNAALGSPMASKKAGQDIYGNLKIPMIEPLVASDRPSYDGWYQIIAETNVWYSSLTGLPIVDSLPKEGSSEFTLDSWYAYTNCSATRKSDWPPDMWDPIPGYDVLWNNLTLTFILKSDSSKVESDTSILDDGQPIAFSIYSGETNATCTMTPTRVSTHFACLGTACNATAIRLVDDQPRPKRMGLLGANFKLSIQLLNMASNIGYRAGDDWYTSPVEQYFIDPAYPFTDKDKHADLLAVGNEQFSRRFTQLFNTLWIPFVAPSLVVGRQDAGTEAARNLTQMATTSGTITTEEKVIVCHYVWFWILILASSVMVSAGAASVVIDTSRRGPDVLDGLSLGLRDNPFVRLATGNSMDDGDDLARRFKKVKVRLGDVQCGQEVGHVAVGTPMPDQPVRRLVQGRLYD